MTIGLFEYLFLVAIIVIGVADYFNRQHLPHIEKAHLLKQEFFKSARVLLKDSRTPSELVDLIAFMGQHINSAWPARRLARDLLSGNFREVERNPNEKQREFIVILDQLPQEIHQRFSVVTCAFVLATTYRSFLFGWALRRIMVMWVPFEDETPPTIPVFVNPTCVADSNTRVVVANIAYSR